MNRFLLKACLISLAAAALWAPPARAAAEAARKPAELLLNPEDLNWVEGPSSLPKGSHLAVLNGDPDETGPFTIRLMLPADYKVGPHWHARGENLTVVSGALYLGMSDKEDASKARALGTGGYHYLSAQARHFVFTKEPTVIQISGEGPFDMHYVSPADDPRGAGGSSGD